MRVIIIQTTMSAVALAALVGFAVPAFPQEKPANNMEIVHEKLKADKKLIVAKYMELTESEAKRFWPVYEDYQNDLQKINERLLNMLQSYAADYRNKSLTDEKAKQLLDEWIALEQDEVKQRSAYASKVLKALPAKKAARYLQIENEYRMLIRYDLAATVPLVQ
jgi:Skp family chaperone for outer membrane proteins